MAENMIYCSAVYGEGTIVSRHSGWIIVRFDKPPGMKQCGGVVPVIWFKDN